MASQGGFVVENKFTQGLITESTALNYPQDACTDTLNCIFNEFGKVSRRYGLDLESSYVENTITPSTGDVYTEYIWNTSAAANNQTFYVQQVGNNLYFFDITSSTTVSLSLWATQLDLNDYLPSGSSADASTYPCQYAIGNGHLLISNQVTNPFYVKWDETISDITATTITLKHRDTDGVDDGLSITARPTATLSGLSTSNPSHYYNIMNQGWYNASAIAQWDTDRADMPSNADVVAYYRLDNTDAYSSSAVTALDPGNSPAPKGHFILNVGEDDRTAAAVAEGYVIVVPGGSALIAAGTGAQISDGGWTNLSKAWDGITYASTASGNFASQTCTTLQYIGKNFSGVSGKKIGSAAVMGTNTDGFVVSSTASLTFNLYAKASAPANSTDGTLLGTTVFNDFSTSSHGYSVGITNTVDTTTSWNYVWVQIKATSGSSTAFKVVEVQLYTPAASYYRPRCIAFFAGRAFYAGVDGTGTGSNIYFSQLTTQPSNYGLCYQLNDPSSEKTADLLATDGGVIKIPEMGKVKRLFPFQAALMVFADNGVWLIKGEGSNGFAATGYRVQRISNIGMQSPNSVVDVRGIPMWWAEDGIYTIQYDANYDSTTVKSLTEETIKTYVQAVPTANIPYIKACFDKHDNHVYFMYNSGTSLTADQLQTFNTILVFNVKTSAWFPWTIDNTTTSVPLLKGGLYIQDGDRSSTRPITKFVCTYTRSAVQRMTWCRFFDSTNWKDWYNYDQLINSVSMPIDYSSYVIAGYRIDGEGMRNFSAPYVWTFMNTVSGSSLLLQGRWEFTNSGSSGKWSTSQQAYDSLTTRGRSYMDVRITRRVVRGTGKGLQIKYTSASGLPFELIGWGIFAVGKSEA